ncbi:MAG: hypothetical protein QXI02_02160, partial [Candidatus Caldarchaeum sp.]
RMAKKQFPGEVTGVPAVGVPETLAGLLSEAQVKKRPAPPAQERPAPPAQEKGSLLSKAAALLGKGWEFATENPVASRVLVVPRIVKYAKSLPEDERAAYLAALFGGGLGPWARIQEQKRDLEALSGLRQAQVEETKARSALYGAQEKAEQQKMKETFPSSELVAWASKTFEVDPNVFTGLSLEQLLAVLGALMGRQQMEIQKREDELRKTISELQKKDEEKARQDRLKALNQIYEAGRRFVLDRRAAFEKTPEWFLSEKRVEWENSMVEAIKKFVEAYKERYGLTDEEVENIIYQLSLLIAAPGGGGGENMNDPVWQIIKAAQLYAGQKK